MSNIINNWIQKAENDYKIGVDELTTDKPTTDMVCFHFQQCIEKYLKAFLIQNDQEISKTHDIAEIIQQCIDIDKDFEELFLYNTDDLTVYAVEIRYPDDFYIPSLEEANTALATTDKAKKFIVEKFKT